MPEQQQIQINLEPNVHTITNINLNPGEEEFILLIMSGNNARQYSMNPKHAKRFSMLLQNAINEYEKKFGELKTELPTVNNNQTETKKFGFQADKD